MNLDDLLSRLDIPYAVTLVGFASSPEYARVAAPRRSPRWAAAFLEAMQCLDLGWNEVDVYALAALLPDTLARARVPSPVDPAVVAGELEALIRYAGRVFELVDTAQPLAYLMSRAAARDIAVLGGPRAAGASG